MYEKKKGLSMIECIAYMAVSVIICGILMKDIINCDSIYLKMVQIYDRESDMDNLLINIERFLNEEDVNKVEVKNNRIIILKGNEVKNFKKEEIFKDESRLIIKYYDIRNFEDYNTRNTLALEVEDFKVNIKGKLIYIIIQKGGKEYIKCL